MAVRKKRSNASSLVSSGASPFTRVVTLGYYDGPLSGVCDWPRARLAIYFRVLAWRADRDSRLFVGFKIERSWIKRLLTMSDGHLTDSEASTLKTLVTGLGNPQYVLFSDDLSTAVDVYELAPVEAKRLKNEIELTNPFGHGAQDMDKWLSRLAVHLPAA